MNNDGFIRKRNFPCILRYKRFNKKDPEMKWNFFRVLLMLFLPWRKESESYFGEKGQLNTQEIFEQL